MLAGREKSATCAPCHGPAGIAQSSQWPNLAGQHESYLEQALAEYKSGAREDLVMGPMASSLDAETIEQLAAYFAAQDGLYTPDKM
ncbi:MAG TPA: c-type cytochrome [Gammaproteobacteria bacterium]